MANHQILVVDDDQAVATHLCEYLNWLGFSCVARSDGLAALRYLEAPTAPVSLIILDLKMPVLDGRAFLTYRNSIPQLAGIPVIVITGAEKNPHLPGVELVIQKPFEMETLVIAVKKHCAVRDAV